MMPTFQRDNQNRVAIQTRQLKLRADTASEDDFSIEAVISSAEPVRMFDWESWELVDEILTPEGRTEEEHIPFLDSHNRYSVAQNLGHVENIRSEDDLSIGVLMFDGEMELGRSTFSKYRNNHLRSVSVGYVVTRSVLIDQGQTVEVEGKPYTAGEKRKLRVALEWRLHEVSAVNIPADKRANVRDETPGVTRSQVSEQEAVELLRRRQETPDSERSESTTTNPADSGSQRKGSDPVPKETETTTTADEKQRQAEIDLVKKEAGEDAVRAERARVAEIRKIGGDDVRVETIQKAIDDGTSPETFRDVVLAELRDGRKVSPPDTDTPETPAAHTGNRHERDCTVESLGAAIAMRLSQGGNIESTYSRFVYDSSTRKLHLHERSQSEREKQRDQVLEQADRYRRMPLVDICREALRIAELDAPLARDELIQRAMSTPALNSIFSNAVGAELLGNFEGQTDTTRGWCRESDSLDFHPKERHKIDGGRLKKHQRGQEAEHGTASDRKETIRAHRYSKQMTIDEMDIADDTLNALQDGAMEIGLATGTLRPDLVYAVLMANPNLSDGTTLFHADHNNLDAASGSLSGLCTKIANQTNSQGLNLALPARYVITSPTRGDNAYRLLSSRETRGAADVMGTNNPVQRRNLIALEEPRLDTGFVDPDTGAAVAAASDTFFVASQMVAYTLEVIYGLTGRMPSVRSHVLTKGTWGMNWDVKYDLGVAALDFRGLAKSTVEITQ